MALLLVLLSSESQRRRGCGHYGRKLAQKDRVELLAGLEVAVMATFAEAMHGRPREAAARQALGELVAGLGAHPCGSVGRGGRERE